MSKNGMYIATVVHQGIRLYEHIWSDKENAIDALKTAMRKVHENHGISKEVTDGAVEELETVLRGSSSHALYEDAQTTKENKVEGTEYAIRLTDVD